MMETQRSLARAQSIVGPDGVLQAIPQGGPNTGGAGGLVPVGRDPKTRAGSWRPLAGSGADACARAGASQAAANRDRLGRRVARSSEAGIPLGSRSLLGRPLAQRGPLVGR